MIPIRGTIQSRNYPVVNSFIIAVNVLLFLVQITQSGRPERFFLVYGLVPVRYSVPEVAAYFTLGQQVLSFFSFMFLHGGFLHLLGNMWSLYIFGGNVEDRLGPIRYFLFYILCGFASGLSHLVLNWHSEVPTIGASGAIAGVMGAYFLLYPRARILTLIPIFFIPYFVEIPAFFFLGFWFMLQFINAAGTPIQGGGIAWWAHVGGFVFGMIFLKLFLQIPAIGITRRVRNSTSKKTSHRLQAIKTVGTSDSLDLYAFIAITLKEARLGTRKLVNIPWGYQKRLFWVTVPPGVGEGTSLRLSGMGRQGADRRRGDLYLRVKVRE